MYTNVPSILNLSSTSHPIPLQNFLNKQIIEEKVDKLDFIKIRTSDFWKILLRKFLKKLNLSADWEKIKQYIYLTIDLNP